VRGDRGQPSAQFDGQHVTASARQLDGGLAGAAADLQHPTAGTDAGQRRQIVEQGRWIGRPDPVVQRRHPVEAGRNRIRLSVVIRPIIHAGDLRPAARSHLPAGRA